MHRNLALFPLLAPAGAGGAYVLLDEALERRIARITEVSDGGSVPELAFENASAGGRTRSPRPAATSAPATARSSPTDCGTELIKMAR